MWNNKNSTIYPPEANKEITINKFEKEFNVIQFKIRLNKYDIETIKGLFDVNPIQKNIRKKTDIVQIAFKNDECVDDVCWHIKIVAHVSYIPSVKNILESKFINIKYRRIGRTISTHLNISPLDKVSYWGSTMRITNKYPICIVSLGRHNKYGKTHKFLTESRIDHYLFVESNELDSYIDWFDDTYCTLIECDNFSQLNMGSTPVRNYCLDYFKTSDYVWILDDNIIEFQYWCGGYRRKITSGVVFRALENYIDGCENVGIMAHNLHSFCPQSSIRPHFNKNCRCYSSMLIKNNGDLRFRHKHHEDNFISIEAICKGYITLSCNFFLYNKEKSGNDKGGNQVSIYKNNSRLEKYNYSYNTTRQLLERGEITIKANKNPETLVIDMKNDGIKHSKWQYKHLKNYDNKVIFKSNTGFMCFDSYIYGVY